MTSQDWFTKDFYAALGVPKSADAAAIKKAYRKLAKDLHPDRHPGDKAAEARFKEVGEAYGVLSDKDQRQKYDAIRTMGGGGPRFQAGSGGGAGFEDVMGGMFGNGPVRGQGFEDMLGNLFGGGFRQGPAKGSDVAAATEVTFRQAAEGATVSLSLDGRTVTTRLPVGVKSGQRIRIAGKGRPGVAGGPAGDLLLTVHVGKHPVFATEGQNLRVKLPVSFDEAVLGASIDVPTLDGSKVRVKIPAGTSSGQTLRVKGRGLTGRSSTGDLLVTVDVQVPTKLSKAAREALQAFALETAADDPRATFYQDASRN
ncbi:MAG: molecular chaperone DnaJ [Actinobacteria bacterium HGW-Actinobacteria-4]|nr:MAG: molecular chaperone DnaJ [Actinobacteria bacterium HGW-Actinobacteria-4]